jgi:hypothetical protein
MGIEEGVNFTNDFTLLYQERWSGGPGEEDWRKRI